MQKDSGKIRQVAASARRGPLALSAAGLLAVLLALPCAPCRAAGFTLGERAPDFEAEDLSGKTVSLSDMLRGDKPVVISFFGTWCDSCLREMTDLAEIAPKYNTAVYLVGVDADKDKLVRFAEKHKLAFPVLWDPKARITGRKYDLLRGAILVVPKAFIISPAGTVEYVSEAYDEEKKAVLIQKLAEVSAKKWDKAQEIGVFFTGSINGSLAPSYARKQAYGGFIKLLSFLKQQLPKYPDHLLLDSGDFLPYSVSAAQAGPVLRAMELAGYDAIAAGDQDVYFSGFREAIGGGKLPFIASNLAWKAGKSGSAGRADKTVVLGGVKVRILSYISPETFSLYPESFTGKLEFSGLKDALKDGKNADYLILLYHAAPEETGKIAEEFKEVDLVIGGHSQDALSKPSKAGNALIVQSGGNLERAGRLVLRFDAAKKLSSHTYELISLTNDIPDDPQIEALIKESKAAAKRK